VQEDAVLHILPQSWQPPFKVYANMIISLEIKTPRGQPYQFNFRGVTRKKILIRVHVTSADIKIGVN
jgi:hypothetical protein